MINFNSIHIVRKLQFTPSERNTVESIIKQLYLTINKLNELLNLHIRIVNKKGISNRTLIVCVGGDGTVLHGAQLASRTGASVVGIHAGNLGFLCEFNRDEFMNLYEFIITHPDVLTKHVKDNYLISCLINRRELFAVNELHFTSKHRSSLRYTITVNNNPIIINQLADGLIISTPIGSTGYNLSAGGSIVDHNCPVVQITPIAAHSLTSRPIIISNQSKINISFQPLKDDELQVFSDGQSTNCDPTVNSFDINGCGPIVEFISLTPNRDVFQILSSKMNWNNNQLNKVLHE